MEMQLVSYSGPDCAHRGNGVVSYKSFDSTNNNRHREEFNFITALKRCKNREKKHTLTTTRFRSDFFVRSLGSTSELNSNKSNTTHILLFVSTRPRGQLFKLLQISIVSFFFVFFFFFNVLRSFST